MAVKGRIKIDLTDPDFDAVLERYDMLLKHLAHPGVPEEIVLLFADRIRIMECSCWVWAGDRDPKHYGRFSPGAEWADSYRSLAHRASWTLFTGSVPGTKVVDHTCPDRSCVAPHHLQAITRAKNTSLGSTRTRVGKPHGEAECGSIKRKSRTYHPTGSWVQRWRRNWSLLKETLPEGVRTPERMALFAAYLDTEDGPSRDPLSAVDTDCWRWKGAIQDGYGFVTWACPKGTPRMAHLWSHDWFIGKRTKGMHVDHLCRNKACVRPSHLELVTSQENNRRGLGVSALNAAKTECHRGHPLEGDNLIVSKSGGRSCRTCGRKANTERARKTRADRAGGILPRSGRPEKCQKGHLYSEENTRITPTGSRRCRRCAADGAKRLRQKNNEAGFTS